MAKGAIQIGANGNSGPPHWHWGHCQQGPLTLNRIDALASGGGFRGTFWSIRWCFCLGSWLEAEG